MQNDNKHPTEHSEPAPASKWRDVARRAATDLAARTERGEELIAAATRPVVRHIRTSLFWRGSDAPKLMAAILLVVGALLAFQNAIERKIDEASNTVRQGPPRVQADGTYLRSAPLKTLTRAHSAENEAVAREAIAPSFDTLAVMRLLQEIGRDSAGNMVMDGTTLRLLDQAVLNLHDNTDAAALAVIGGLIEAELPGLEGTKARETFMLYLQYKAAEAELLRHAQEADKTTLQANLEETRALRRRYFGAERAAQLFAEPEPLSSAGLVGMAEAERRLAP